MNLSPEKARTIHNFLRKSLSKNDDTSPDFVYSVTSQGELVQGSWRSEKGNSLGIFSSSIVSKVARKASKNAKVIQEIFTEYFMNKGIVEWQWGKT